MLAVSKTYLEMPVILHEFTPRAVPAEQLDQPTEVLRRARLYAVAVPPDQLNPDGYYDGQLSAMLARHTRKKSSAGLDSRAGTLPQNLPSPGNPALAGKIPVTEMTWTVRVDHEYTVKAAPLKSKVPTLGYLLAEANRSGRLYPGVATALGVTNRDLFTDLKEGRSVIADDGSEVRPEQCVGPPRPGRRLAVVPPCGDSTSFAASIGKADLLIHSMVPPEGVSIETAEKAAEMAGTCAAAMNCCEVVLWQPLISFLDSEEAVDENFPLRAIQSAKEAFGKEFVSFGGTFRVHQWERDEGPRVPTDLPSELMHLIPEDA
jgi:ribonuclease Z